MLGSSITIISSFIIQANVITIIHYDRKTFIVQATGKKCKNLFFLKSVFSSFFCLQDEVVEVDVMSPPINYTLYLFLMSLQKFWISRFFLLVLIRQLFANNDFRVSGKLSAVVTRAKF